MVYIIRRIDTGAFVEDTRGINAPSHEKYAARACAILNAHDKRNGHGFPNYETVPDTSHVKIGDLNLPDWAIESLASAGPVRP